MMLDPKALEAAIIAGDKHWEGDRPSTGIYEAAIRAYLSASIPAEIGELVERLEEEGFLRAREKQELHGGDERWLNDRIQKDLCSRAASLIQSQAAEIERWHTEYLNAASDAQKFAARIAALEAGISEFADPANWTVNVGFDPHSGNFNATTFARALLNRRAEG